MWYSVQTALLGFMVLSVTGCGTVVNGIYQDLAITSNPGGAQVSVDGISSGTTPVVVPVTRNHAHVVKLEQAGYQPIEASVVPQTSIWEWGNVIFAWLPGLAVDAWTGGMYQLSYDRVNAVFPAQTDKTVKTAQGTSVK